jgi:hypothetical protein
MPRKSSRSLNPPRAPFPTSDEIADRAYEMYLRDRTLNGNRGACWREAENELLERAARRVIASVHPARRT